MDFTMADVFYVLGRTEDTSRRHLAIECPSGCPGGCPSRRKIMDVNFDKNMFRCSKGDVSGGVVKMYSILADVPYDDAGKLLFKQLKGDTRSYNRKTVRQPHYYTEEPVTPLSVRHDTYSALLKLLTLNEKHISDLRRRGMDKATALSHGYRSYPKTGLEAIASQLLTNGYILKGVPPFYKNEKGNWTLRPFSNGYLIPQMSVDGRIQGFQIRLDKGDVRYLTVSSADLTEGASGKAYPSYRMGSIEKSSIIITEGPLKGDLITHMSGRSTLAVQGVNSLALLPDALKQLSEKENIKKIFIAYDMDILDNPKVAEATSKLEKMIVSHNMDYIELRWDSRYKGLDDFYASLKEAR